MKGTYRSVQKTSKPHGRTNFDDWSDPLLRRIQHKASTKSSLTEYEKRARLDKFKSKTAYCQTVNDIDNIRLKVKQGEPLLHHKEIRHLKLPFYNGLVMNLKDDGHPATSEYIKELIVLDDMTSKHDPNRELLRSNKTVLHKLAEDLKLAEDAKRNENRTGEVQALMDLALYFMKSESSFYWLAEELLEQSIDLLNNPRYPVEPQVEAILRYLYSSYLLDIAHDLINAKQQLEISMKLSMGKNIWIINEDGKKGDMLYLKSCILLSKINLEEAYQQKSMDVEKAIQSCRLSLHWAKQANDESTIATVLLTLADFYLDANQLSPVIDLIREHTKRCKSSKNYRELCEGYVLLSKYHEAVGNQKEVVDVIEELISFALDQGILDIVLKAHLKLAEIYGIRRMGKIRYHAAAAFKYCKNVGKEEEIESAKCFLGIAQGDPIWCEYVNLVLFSDSLESDELKSLINWKMLRTPFFNEDISILYQSESQDILRIKSELEQTKTDEVNAQREKLRSITRGSTRSRLSNALQRFDSSNNSIRLKKSMVGSNLTELSFQLDAASVSKTSRRTTKSVSFIVT